MVSVAEVLQADVALDVVVCPSPDAPVRWVATNEMADPTPFLEGGELLLCTGLESTGWGPEQWQDYVDLLRGSQVAALGLAIGPTLTHAKVPAGLKDACLRRRLNLLTVPMQTSFVSISQAVAGLLEDQDRKAAHDAVSQQRRLAQAALRREAPKAIIGQLASYVTGAVWLLTPEGALITGKGDGARAEPLLQEIRMHLPDVKTRGLGAVTAWSTEGAHTSIRPIGLHEPPEAYVAVRTPVALDEYQGMAVLTSIALLSVELQRRLEQRESARMLQRRAFDLLLEGEVRAATLILDAEPSQPGKSSKMLPTTVKVIRVGGPRNELHRLLGRAEESTTSQVDIVVMAPSGGELHVLCAATAAERWARSLQTEGLRVGIGSAAAGHSVDKSFRTAGLALERATAQRPIVLWEALSDSGLTSLVDPESREAFADELLGRLKGTASGPHELMRVAASFIRHHGRVHVVADEIGMHRNTVRARVREIENAVGMDLDDPTDRLNLWAALQISRQLDL